MVGMVADDLTGACDSAAPLLALGRVLVYIWPRMPGETACACLALSTETRSDATAEEARQRVRAAVAHLRALGAGVVFKKVDSRLRGHVRPELEGALQAWPGRLLLAPALPGEGRFTRQGRQVTSTEQVDLVALTAGLVRIEVADAETDEDLDRVAQTVCADPSLMPAGTAGLAAAVARQLARQPAAPGSDAGNARAWPSARRPLVLAGSKTETTATQLERATEAGWKVIVRHRGDAVPLDDHDALFLTGGGTAAGVVQALGGHGLELLGEVLPRVPVGRILDGPHAGLIVCLKSGGFGGPDAIDLALRRLSDRA